MTGGISDTAGSAGVVELINNAGRTDSLNLIVGGTINTNANALGGGAGSIAIVSSGAIKLGNITASAGTVGTTGGDVFISSGSRIADSIVVGTINTSAPTGNVSLAAGNIIMICLGTTTATNPDDIVHGTITQTGGTKGLLLDASFPAASIADYQIPAQVNITYTITGPDAFNLTPGGYSGIQGSAASPISFSINNPDSRMIAPINLSFGIPGQTGITIGSITQANGFDNVNIVAGESIVFTKSAQFGQNTGNILIASLVQISEPSNLNLQSQSGVVLFAPLIGVGNLTVTAQHDIFIDGPLVASISPNQGGSVLLNSALGNVTTVGINTSGVDSGSGATGGNLVINAPNGAVSTSDINASSISGAGGFDSVGAGSIAIYATRMSIGEITNAGTGFVTLTGTGTTPLFISTGDILSSYAGQQGVTNVTIVSNGTIITGDITTAASSGNGGGVLLQGNQVIAGNINTSSQGNFGGPVSIFGGVSGGVGNVDIASINTSTSGAAQSGGGGNVIVLTTGNELNIGTGGINTSANYSGSGTGNGGNVIITSAQDIFGANITTNSVTSSGSGSGGTIAITAGTGSIVIGNIDATGGTEGTNQTAGTGGNINLVASGNGIFTGNIDLSGVSQGGTLMEFAPGGGAFNGSIHADSNQTAGSVTIIANTEIEITNTGIIADGE